MRNASAIPTMFGEIEPWDSMSHPGSGASLVGGRPSLPPASFTPTALAAGMRRNPDSQRPPATFVIYERLVDTRAFRRGAVVPEGIGRGFVAFLGIVAVVLTSVTLTAVDWLKIEPVMGEKVAITLLAGPTVTGTAGASTAAPSAVVARPDEATVNPPSTTIATTPRTVRSTTASRPPTRKLPTVAPANPY